jgi:homopolymeric O-antigen transport system permease protein
MEAKTETEAGTPHAARRGASATLRQRFVQGVPFARGLRDLWQGWRDYRELWLTTGWYDIRKRYRRSLLRPFWITISLGTFIAGLTFIYMPLVGSNAENYLPYLAFGFIAWQMISNLVIEGCNVLIANGFIISSGRLSASMSIRWCGGT